MSIIGTRPPLISETNFYELHHRAIYYFILVYIQMVLLIPVTFKLLRSRFSKLGWFVTPVV